MADTPIADRPISPVLALIPARGGSKSVPRKNILPVAGRPLLAWSIDQARRCAAIDRVIVSTDDAEIAEVARAAGAEVPFLRPAEAAGDLARDLAFFHHALDWLDRQEAYRPGLIVNLRPTMPVRRVETIARAVAALADTPAADSLRSVRAAEQSPYKMWRIGADGMLTAVATLDGDDEPYNAPRQTLPAIYWQDGYVDVTRWETVMVQGSTTGRVVLPFLIDEPGHDIDYLSDVATTERLLLGQAAASALDRSRDGQRHPS